MIKTENKFAYFNLLKFVGIFIITIFLHYYDHFLHELRIENPNDSNVILHNLFCNSYVLVELFFIISGILFVVSYEKRILKKMSFDDFIINRIIRVFPSLIITSIIVYILNYILFDLTGKLWALGTLNVSDLVIDIIFGGKALFNGVNTLNGPIWYLGVLIFCYIIAYVLVKLSQKYQTNFFFIIPIFLGVAILYTGKYYPLLSFHAARGYIAFFTGVFLGKSFKYLDVLNRKKLFYLRILLIILLAIFLHLWRLDYFGNIFIFFSLVIFPIIIILLYDIKLLNRICQTRIVKFLSNISFEMYLWNFPIYLFLHILIIEKIIKMDITSVAFFILLIMIHLIVAIISYYVIDRKICLRLKELYHELKKIN